jgi:hypothetical protein
MKASPMKIKALRSFETSGISQPTAQHHTHTSRLEYSATVKYLRHKNAYPSCSLVVLSLFLRLSCCYANLIAVRYEKHTRQFIHLLECDRYWAKIPYHSITTAELKESPEKSIKFTSKNTNVFAPVKDKHWPGPHKSVYMIEFQVI